MPNKISHYFDSWSLVVIVITFLLFFLALFAKGFTHDLLLEAGVFLVSVKLIMLGYKNDLQLNNINNQLKDIRQMLKEKKDVL